MKLRRANQDYVCDNAMTTELQAYLTADDYTLFCTAEEFETSQLHDGTWNASLAFGEDVSEWYCLTGTVDGSGKTEFSAIQDAVSKARHGSGV